MCAILFVKAEVSSPNKGAVLPQGAFRNVWVDFVIALPVGYCWPKPVIHGIRSERLLSERLLCPVAVPLKKIMPDF